MRDRIVQYPNRYKLTNVGGDIYDITLEPGIVTEQGTSLNKANLLSDATAALIGGLGSDPTVNAALAALAPRAKIGVLSYVGTGTYGAANPNTVVFDFVPKIAFLVKRSNCDHLTTATFIHGSSVAMGYGRNDSYHGSYVGAAYYYRLATSWNDATPSLSWYNNDGSGADFKQGNESDSTYDIIYFG